MLITDFFDVFDFHFINPSFLKSIYDFQNEIIKNFKIIEAQQKEKIDICMKDNEIMRGENEKMKIENEKMRDENKKMRDENEKMRVEIEETRTELDSLKKEISKMMRTLTQKSEILKIINDEMKKSIPIISFQYSGNSNYMLRGIIQYFTKYYKGNVDEKGVIKVTSSSVANDKYQCKNAVDLDDNTSYFTSKDEDNAWLKYDFLDHKFRPTYYVIRSRNEFPNKNPKNWVIEGSNTEIDDDWMILDTRENNAALESLNTQRCYYIHIIDGQIDCYRYIRIRLTGPNTYGDKVLSLSALEYFGYLY